MSFEVWLPAGLFVLYLVAITLQEVARQRRIARMRREIEAEYAAIRDWLAGRAE